MYMVRQHYLCHPRAHFRGHFWYCVRQRQSHSPQAATRAIRREVHIALNGQVVIRPMMYVALSYDHRIVDGNEAARFLVRIKELVEDPESLLLEG